MTDAIINALLRPAGSGAPVTAPREAAGGSEPFRSALGKAQGGSDSKPAARPQPAKAAPPDDAKPPRSADEAASTEASTVRETDDDEIDDEIGDKIFDDSIASDQAAAAAIVAPVVVASAPTAVATPIDPSVAGQDLIDDVTATKPETAAGAATEPSATARPRTNADGKATQESVAANQAAELAQRSEATEPIVTGAATTGPKQTEAAIKLAGLIEGAEKETAPGTLTGESGDTEAAAAATDGEAKTADPTVAEGTGLAEDLQTASELADDTSSDTPVAEKAEAFEELPENTRTDDTAPAPRHSSTERADRVLAGGRSQHDAAAQAAPRVDATRFVNRVSRAFEAANEQGGPLRLRLSPPELGVLRIELTLQQGVMTAQIETETSAARTVLLDNLPALRERLAEQEIRVDKFNVDVGSENQQGNADWDAPREQAERAAARQLRRSAATSAAAATSAPTQPRSIAGNGQFNAVA